MGERPGALRRLLFRAPLALHRVGLHGFERVLGIDWILVTTRGRRTRQPRPVMLDLIGEDAAGATYYVQPAFGRDADWVRNVIADPIVTVTVRGRTLRGRVADVTGPEGAEVVLRFIRAHPLYARIVVWFVGYVESIDLPDDELRNRLATTLVFAIRCVPDDQHDEQ